MWDFLLLGARVLQFAGALVLLGTTLFCMYGLQAATRQAISRRSRWPCQVLAWSAIMAIAGTILWVMAETVLFSGNPADGTDPAAVWVVLSETRFGRVCLWRIGLLLVSVAASLINATARILQVAQVALASAIVASFAWTGHGAMTAGWQGAAHLAGDILHLWFAGVWFGALLPLAILVSRARQSGLQADALTALHGLERFSAIGATVVVILALTGLVNTWFLVGASWRLDLLSAYGVALLVKIFLFGCMLTLAATNRFWWTPALHRKLKEQTGTSASVLGALSASVLVETGIAFLILAIVGVLGTLEPPVAH